MKKSRKNKLKQNNTVKGLLENISVCVIHLFPCFSLLFLRVIQLLFLVHIIRGVLRPHKYFSFSTKTFNACLNLVSSPSSLSLTFLGSLKTVFYCHETGVEKIRKEIKTKNISEECEKKKKKQFERRERKGTKQSDNRFDMAA